MTERENKIKELLSDIYSFLEEGHYDNDPSMNPLYERVKEALSLFDKDESNTFVQKQPLFFYRELIISQIPNSDLKDVHLDVSNVHFGYTYIDGVWVRTSDSTISIYTYYDEVIYNAINKWWQYTIALYKIVKADAKLVFLDEKGNVRKIIDMTVCPDFIIKTRPCDKDVMEITFSFHQNLE